MTLGTCRSSKALVQRGVDFNLGNDSGLIPVEGAIRFCRLSIVQRQKASHCAVSEATKREERAARVTGNSA